MLGIIDPITGSLLSGIMDVTLTHAGCVSNDETYIKSGTQVTFIVGLAEANLDCKSWYNLVIDICLNKVEHTGVSSNLDGENFG